MTGENHPSSPAALNGTAQQNGAKPQALPAPDHTHANKSNGTHIPVSPFKEARGPSPATENGTSHAVKPQPTTQQPEQPSAVRTVPPAQAHHTRTDSAPPPSPPTARLGSPPPSTSRPAAQPTAPPSHTSGAADAKSTGGIDAPGSNASSDQHLVPPTDKVSGVSKADDASAGSGSKAGTPSHPPSSRVLPAGAVAIPPPATVSTASLPTSQSSAAPASTIHPVVAFQQLQLQQQQRQLQQQQNRQHSSSQSQMLSLPTIQQQLLMQTQMRTQQAQQVQQAQQALQAGMGKQTSLQQHPHPLHPQQQASSLQQQAGQHKAGMHLLTNQQHPRLAVAMQPRLAPLTSGWPVPLPKNMTGGTGLGIKRSASGESAAGAAKKQKTAPSSYQQAQDHMRAQQARQSVQSAAQKKLAEDLFQSLAPSLGPLLSLPTNFATTHAKEIEMALKSGLNSSIAWSLNALAVLSFNARHPLLLADHPGILEALLQVMESGLDDSPSTAPVNPEECLTAAEALIPGKAPQPKPGEPQGWWWEREAGLLAPREEDEWGFSHACCACNVLRNLAMEPNNHALLTGEAVLRALLACLAAQQDAACPDSNMLASDALDVLQRIGPRLILPALPPDLPSALIAHISRMLHPWRSPMRLRITAAGVADKVADVPSNREAFGQLAGQGQESLLDGLNLLLRTDISQARQQVDQQLAGTFGSTEQEVQGMRPEERHAMALRLQAQALFAAAKATRSVVQSISGRQAATKHSHLFGSVVQLLLSSHMQDLAEWHKSTQRERLKDGLLKHMQFIFYKMLQFCVAALLDVCLDNPEASQKLQKFELQLAEAAMTETPQADWIATLLHRAFPPFLGV